MIDRGKGVSRASCRPREETEIDARSMHSHSSRALYVRFQAGSEEGTGTGTRSFWILHSPSLWTRWSPTCTQSTVSLPLAARTGPAFIPGLFQYFTSRRRDSERRNVRAGLRTVVLSFSFLERELCASISRKYSECKITAKCSVTLLRVIYLYTNFQFSRKLAEFVGSQ